MTAYQQEAARREAMRQDRLRPGASLRQAPQQRVPDVVDQNFYHPYLAIARYWIIVVAFAVLGSGVVAGSNAVRAPSYISTSTVTWNPNYRAELPALLGAPSANIQPALDLAAAAVWVRGDVVMSTAATLVGVAVGDLRDETTVATSPLDETITITVRADSAMKAQEHAQAVTNSFVRESQNRVLTALRTQAAQVAAALNSIRADVRSTDTSDLRNNQALLTAAASGAHGPAAVVQGATTPVDTRGTIALSAATGGALGLVLGVLLAVAWDARDRRRRQRSSSV